MGGAYCKGTHGSVCSAQRYPTSADGGGDEQAVGGGATKSCMVWVGAVRVSGGVMGGCSEGEWSVGGWVSAIR